MSDPAGSGRSAVRRPGLGLRLLAVLLPGTPQLLVRRWGRGALLLLAWLGLLSLAVTRMDRVFGAGRGARLEAWVAALTLVALAGGVALYAYRDALRFADVAEPRPRGQWGLVAQAFRRNRLAVFGLGVIALLYAAALLTPLLAPYNPLVPGDLASERLLSPSGSHWLGTDHFGRDVLSRILYGARISLTIGFVAVGISITIGTLLGAVSGYVGGRADAIIMRFVDMIISFPSLVLLITVVALFTPSIFLIVAVLGLTQWPGTARIVRGEVLSLKERDFVQAARALGYSRRRIVLRHLIPNALAPVIVTATLGIGNVIVLEAGLSFLGFGVQPPTPSWGTMVADGRVYLLNAWWLATCPGLAIVFTVLSFNLVGDGLRDALDPRLRA